jgi:protein-disulfide isomerase
MRKLTPKTWIFLLALCMTTTSVTAGCLGKRRPQADAQRSGARPSADAAQVRVIGPDAVDESLSKLVTGERKQVLYDADDPHKGAAAPMVTIVEYSDFQCPFCGRLAATLEQVLEEYPDDVRLVFKQFPLAMHADAEPAARAALAAHAQGKFWPMHDLLFANPRALTKTDLERYATDIGLDMEAFGTRVESDEAQMAVREDMREGGALEIRSTPSFFINGQLVTGAKPIEEIKAIVEAEKQLADKLIEAGSKREEVYARIMKAAQPVQPPAKDEPAPDPTHRRGEASKVANYAISVGEDRPTLGPEDALVTIIEYGALDCEDCRAAEKTLAALRKAHPEVRFAFRHLVGESSDAQGAALAALAAHRQGKFWEMRQKLLASDETLSFDKVVAYAKELGLDQARFTKDVRDPSLREIIKQDEAVAGKVRGTAEAPIFFVNGRFLQGTPSLAEFEALIAEEQAKAKKFVEDNRVANRGDLYEAMRKTWRGYELIEAAAADAAG